MSTLEIIIDEMFSALMGRPSNYRIQRWRHYLASDAERGKPWSAAEIAEFVPRDVQPYLN
jgi:hypothetical protein